MKICTIIIDCTIRQSLKIIIMSLRRLDQVYYSESLTPDTEY